MKIILDTSSLIKLYRKESGTEEIERILSNFNFTTTYLSEKAKNEFTSTLRKKDRTKEISKNASKVTINLFKNDFDKFSFILVDNNILDNSRLLFYNYGIRGLRTFDAIQLFTALSLKTNSDLCITSDILLNSFFVIEGLKTI